MLVSAKERPAKAPEPQDRGDWILLLESTVDSAIVPVVSTEFVDFFCSHGYPRSTPCVS